jgi:anti-anti-sigma factor
MSLGERSINVDQSLLGLRPNPPGQSEPPLVAVTWEEDVAFLALSGEIDVAAAPSLDESLDGLIPDLRTGLVVDLSCVTFLDSTGLAFLITADNRVRAEGGYLIVYSPPAQVRRLLELSGLTSVLLIAPEEPET